VTGPHAAPAASLARALARLVPTALSQAASAHARTPGASRAHSRLASPAPLVLDSWCEDESLSSASDLFDSPASWFSEEDGFGSLAGLRSAPLSSCSIRTGELAFMSGAETDSKMGTPAATPAPDAEEDAAPFWSISSSAASSAQLLEDEGGAARTPPAPRKRKRAARDGHAPSGEAICAALLAAVPAVEIEEEPAQKRFELKMPLSYSSDLGETWQWEVSEFPIVSNTQRPAMLRLKEGPIVLCSFTDEARKPKA
jgi:hypothetical protein